MHSRNLKWWFALIGYVCYILAFIFNSTLVTITAENTAGNGIELGTVFNILMFIIAGVLCLITFRLITKGKLTREEFGFSTGQLGQLLLIGGGLGIAFLGISELVEMNNKTLREASKEVMSSLNIGKSVTHDVLLILNVGLFAPVFEEIVFRGGIFNPILQGLKKYKSLPSWLILIIALTVSTFAFTSSHGGGGQDAQMWLLALLSISCAMSMYLTKSIYGAILVHAVNNNLVLILAFWKQPNLEPSYIGLLVLISITCLILCIPMGKLSSKILKT